MSRWSRFTNAVRGVARTVAPVAAGFIPGVGAIAAPLVGAALQRQGSRGAQPSLPPMALMGPPAVPDYGGGMIQTAGATGTFARGAAAAVGGAVRATGRRAAKLVIQGRRVSLAQLKRLVRSLGPEAVAVALGLSVANLASIMFDMEPKTARRRRGISYADIARTRRTLRKFASMQSMIACAPARSRPCVPRRRTK